MLKKRVLTLILISTMVSYHLSPMTVLATEPDAATYTVNPGDNLWNIAHSLSNSGIHWKNIYEQNRDIIKNPSLILIGQILSLPQFINDTLHLSSPADDSASKMTETDLIASESQSDIAPSLPASSSAYYLADQLHQLGYQVYYCGAYARDLLRGKGNSVPELVCDADLDALTFIFSDRLSVSEDTRGTYANIATDLGTVKIAPYQSLPDYYQGFEEISNHATTSLLTDSFTRDFTINSIYIDPFSHAVIDFHHGQEDLANGVIDSVVTPEIAFTQYPEHTMQAISLAQQLNFCLSDRIVHALRKHSRKYVALLPADSIYTDLEELFSTGNTASICQMLMDTRYIEFLFPVIGNYHNTREYQQILSDQISKADAFDPSDFSSAEDRFALIFASILYPRYLQLLSSEDCDSAIADVLSEQSQIIPLSDNQKSLVSQYLVSISE